MTYRRCPLCDADQPTVLATITAGQVCTNSTYAPNALAILNVSAADTYPFVQCGECRFIYVQSAPSPDLLAALYERVVAGAAARNESQQPAWVAHQLGLAQKLLERFGNEGPVRILDYGCGYGTIVRALAGPLISCIGYEYSQSVAREGQAAGLDILTDFDEIARRGPFDGIILSDVLEHVESPRATLLHCSRFLRPHGWLCVSVPDFGEQRARTIFRQLRRGESTTREVNPWEHLNYFSPATLAAMLERAGFRVHPHATATFGLRDLPRDARRWGNAAKATLRLLRFAGSPRPTGTTLLAQL
jgi:2-polyprenyl-3-methyl-5-hydroxy-6-metoxy-1,4-benzoquinol methylase